VAKGKSAYVPTVGDDKPGLNLTNKKINGVDTAFVEVGDNFYVDKPVYDGEKMLKELQQGFAEVWKKVTSKY
jgi:hypothetical protein